MELQHLTFLLVGLSFAVYIGITPQAIGGLGMIINFVVALAVSQFTEAPPKEVQDMVESLRIPRIDKSS